MYKNPIIDSKANTIVARYKGDDPVRKIAVGPSAPPIIPIELA